MKTVSAEPKRRRNVERHGFDFADVARFDWEDVIVKASHASATGRARFAATGFFETPPPWK
jgi:uncharacterized DUF497 family protein